MLLSVTGKRKRNLSESQLMCSEPVSHIMYLKVGKTGSSTLTNILYRYALRNKLGLMLFRTIPFESRRIERTRFKTHNTEEEEKFDMLAEHLTYNRSIVDKYMYSDAVIFASTRHPLGQYTSQVLYSNKNNSISQHYLAEIIKLDNFEGNILKLDDGEMQLDKNIMSHYFGLPSQQSINASSMHKHVEEIAPDFDLVTVTSYIDESLVLLRRRLCWSLKDMIHVKLRHSKIIIPPQVLSANDTRRHHKGNVSDFILYHYFVAKLMQTLSLQHEDFWRELHFVKQINKRVENYCRKIYHTFIKNSDVSANLILKPGIEDILSISESEWGPAFTLTPTECILMNTEEEVIKNFVKLQRYPQMCLYFGKKKFHNINVRFDITTTNWTLQPFNSQYCSTTKDPKYGISVPILTNTDIFIETL